MRRRSASPAWTTRARDASSAAACRSALELRGAREAKTRSAAILVVVGLHGARVEDREVPEVGAVRGAQAHGEVAVQAHVDGGLVVGEALHERVRHRDDGALGDERARRAVGVVLERLRHGRAVVPAGEHPDVHAVRVVASATMASFASKASARLRTRQRRNSSPISPAVPSASARSRSRPRGPTRVGVVSAGEGKDAIDRS